MSELYRTVRTKFKTGIEKLQVGHRVQHVCEHEFHGRINGKARSGYVVYPQGLGPHSIVYSLGIGFNTFFDDSIIAAHGVQVFGFDPTPRSIEWVATQQMPPQFQFHPYGVADYDGTARFTAPERSCAASYTLVERPDVAAKAPEAPIEAPVYRLSTLMERLGHDHIDILKMDIEGAEYGVIADLLKSRLDVRQVCVEFHHFFREIGPAKTREAVKLLNDAGYRIFHISEKGREYSFLKL